MNFGQMNFGSEKGSAGRKKGDRLVFQLSLSERRGERQVVMGGMNFMGFDE